LKIFHAKPTISLKELRSFDRIRLMSQMIQPTSPPENVIPFQKMKPFKLSEEELIPTQRSLIDRMKKWRDEASWRQFFDTYWKLIYSVARRSELSDGEAQEVVQETMITVWKSMPKFNYDPAIGEFKSWLLTIARCRIVDQVRKRGRLVPFQPLATESSQAPDIADPATQQFDKIWDAEWKENLKEAAEARVRRRANPRHYQLYDFYVNKQWPPEKVAAHFGVSVNQVYLAKNRVWEMITEEAKRLEEHML
jgi:RNA polymerase sigma-70 factor (ECF subfamily)